MSSTSRSAPTLRVEREPAERGDYGDDAIKGLKVWERDRVECEEAAGAGEVAPLDRESVPEGVVGGDEILVQRGIDRDAARVVVDAPVVARRLEHKGLYAEPKVGYQTLNVRHAGIDEDDLFGAGDS
jgi:hypothetical protein